MTPPLLSRASVIAKEMLGKTELSTANESPEFRLKSDMAHVEVDVFQEPEIAWHDAWSFKSYVIAYALWIENDKKDTKTTSDAKIR